MRDQLLTRVKLPATVNLYELGTTAHGGHQYPAVDVSNPWNGNAVGAKLSAGYSNDYGTSVWKGAVELKTYLDERIKACKSHGSKFALFGYSQGAQVIGQTLWFLDDDTVNANILYIGLFGDPKLHLPEGEGIWPAACRGANLSAYRRIIANCHVDNGSLDARKPYLPQSLHDKTGLWCYAEDFVCGSSKNVFKNSGHMTYGSDGNAIDSAVYELALKLQTTVHQDLRQHIVTTRGGGMGTTGLDVVFVIDTTGSMYSRIQQAQQFAAANAEKIIAQRGRVALVSYRDRGDTYTARIESGFSDNLDNFQTKINQLSVDGGGDTPEATLHALMTAFNGLDWKYGATKAAVVLTDAGYHHPDKVDGSTLDLVAKRSLEIDPVNVYPVVPSWVASDYQSLADATSGQVIIDQGNSAAALLEAITKIEHRPTALLKHMEYYADVNQEVTFDASDSYVTDGEITGYEWDFDGDGTFEIATPAPSATHTYTEVFDGIMQVQMRASNGTIANISAFVTIGTPPEPPQAAINAPHSLHIDTLTATSVSVSWEVDDPNTHAWGVALDGVPIGKLDGNLRQVEIADLNRTQPLTVEVIAITEAGDISEAAMVDIPALNPVSTSTSNAPTPKRNTKPHNKTQPIKTPPKQHHPSMQAIHPPHLTIASPSAPKQQPSTSRLHSPVAAVRGATTVRDADSTSPSVVPIILVALSSVGAIGALITAIKYLSNRGEAA